MDTKSQLSRSTVILHWLIAVAIIGSLAFGLYLEDLPRSQNTDELIGLHASIGVTILLFALYRIVVRIRNRLPKPLTVTPYWQQKSAVAAHILLLVGTVLMPVSGIIMSIGGGHSVAWFGLELIPDGDGNELLSDIGHIMHGLGGKLFMLVIMFHIVATLKHQWIDKDATLKRMLGARV